MLTKGFVYKNKVNIAIFLFLLIFVSIHLVKPPLFYNEDGSFREFGLGSQKKSVVPIWVFAICLAIFSYLAVLVFLAYY